MIKSQESIPLKQRISFVYVEHAKIHVDGGSISVSQETGKYSIPVNSMMTLLIGPGCSITSLAIKLISENYTSVMWVGEDGTRFYAQGKPFSGNTSLLDRQVEVVGDHKKRTSVARKMYLMRFPDDERAKNATINTLRGFEGTRVRGLYKKWSEESGVTWTHRKAQLDRDDSDIVNSILTKTNHILYDIITSIILSLGMSPSLGVIHTGNTRSFIFDIADLYKDSITIPFSFQTASKVINDELDIEGNELRRVFREYLLEFRFVKSVISDISELFSIDAINVDIDDNKLWSSQGVISGSTNYGESD